MSGLLHLSMYDHIPCQPNLSLPLNYLSPSAWTILDTCAEFSDVGSGRRQSGRAPLKATQAAAA